MLGNMSNMLGGMGNMLGNMGNTASFNYPDPSQVWGQLYGLPPIQRQTDILGQMATPQAFRSAVNPYIQSVMKGLGRSGIPSSSYADRTISGALGSLWQQWQQNLLGGWQNLWGGMPQMMASWYAPYTSMLGALTS